MPIGNQGGYGPKVQLLPRGLLLLAPNRGNNRAAVEFTWRGLELITGNYYLLTLGVFIAATACALLLSRRLRPERAQSASEPDAVWAGGSKLSSATNSSPWPANCRPDADVYP